MRGGKHNIYLILHLNWKSSLLFDYTYFPVLECGLSGSRIHVLLIFVHWCKVFCIFPVKHWVDKCLLDGWRKGRRDRETRDGGMEWADIQTEDHIEWWVARQMRGWFESILFFLVLITFGSWLLEYTLKSLRLNWGHSRPLQPWIYGQFLGLLLQLASLALYILFLSVIFLL